MLLAAYLTIGANSSLEFYVWNLILFLFLTEKLVNFSYENGECDSVMPYKKLVNTLQEVLSLLDEECMKWWTELLRAILRVFPVLSCLNRKIICLPGFPFNHLVVLGNRLVEVDLVLNYLDISKNDNVSSNSVYLDI